MDRETGSIEVGAYLLDAGGEGGTLLQQGRDGGEAEIASLRSALEQRPPKSVERAPALATEIDEAAEATSKVEQAAALCKGAAEGHALDPDQLALEVGTLLDCLERLDRKKKHKKALQLARSLATLLMLLKRWASLLQTLRIALRAGEELGDESAVAWAQHELGILRLAGGDVEGAERCLRQAREIRERIGDRRGLATTNRNMQVLCERLRDMLQDEELVRSRPGRRPSLRGALAAAALGGFLFVAGVAAGTITGGGSEPVAEKAIQTRGDQSGTDGNDSSGNPKNGTSGNPGGNGQATEYALVITIAGEGGGRVVAGGEECSEGVCEFSFATGTTVQFDYKANRGSEFKGFSGDCPIEGCTLTMDAPKSVTATFEPEASEATESSEGSIEEGEGEEVEEATQGKLSEPEEEELGPPEADE